MKHLAILIAILPVAVQAQTQAPAPAPAPRPAAPASKAIPGVSPAGMAIIDKYRGQNDPQLAALVRQQRDIQQQVVAATLQTPVDPDTFAALLKKRQEAASAVRDRLDAQMIATLRELPEADRTPFLRSRIRTANPQAAVAR